MENTKALHKILGQKGILYVSSSAVWVVKKVSPKRRGENLLRDIGSKSKSLGRGAGRRKAAKDLVQEKEFFSSRLSNQTNSTIKGEMTKIIEKVH